LAILEAELQELVNRLDRVSQKYSLLINVDKTKEMASDGIACRIPIHNEQLKQVDMFPYLGYLITEDGWAYDGISYQVKWRAGDQGITAENMEKSQHIDWRYD